MNEGKETGGFYLIGGEAVTGRDVKVQAFRPLCVADRNFLLMVAGIIICRNDTVVNMDEDGGGNGSPVRTANPPSPSFASTYKQPEVRAFSYYVVVDLGKISLRGGEGSADERR